MPNAKRKEEQNWSSLGSLTLGPGQWINLGKETQG